MRKTDDIATKLSELLGSPDGISKIKSMAEALLGGEDKASSPQPDDNNSGGIGDLLGGFSLPEGLDLVKLIGAFSAFSAPQSDSRTCLLTALKPHLSAHRQERVDKAVKLLKIASVIPVLKEQGLLDFL